MLVSKRLSKIYELIDEGCSLADIGADHGFLVIELAKNKKCCKLFCNDNKEGPYNNLKSNILKHQLNDVEVSLSDGISKLPSYVDTLVLAGMGGDLIVKILTQDKDKLQNVNTIIVSANTNEKVVRKILTSIGYYIDDEVIVFERHFYEIIKFRKGQRQYDEDDYDFGPILRRNKSQEFINKYKELINMYMKIIDLGPSDEIVDEFKTKIDKLKKLIT